MKDGLLFFIEEIVMSIGDFSESFFSQLSDVIREGVIHYVVIAVLNGAKIRTVDISVLNKGIIQSDTQFIWGFQTAEVIYHGRTCRLYSLFSVFRMLVNKGNGLRL